jgi:hypothetical protein
MKKSVKKIYKMCKDYLDFVEGVGNECAYTDSIVREIINESDNLKKAYDKLFSKFQTKSIK